MCLQLHARWHFCLLPSQNSATTFTFLLLLLCCCANSLRISNPWSRSLLIKPIWRRRNEAIYTFSFITRFVYTSPSKNMCNLKKKIYILFFFFDKDLFPNESQKISKVNMTVLEDRTELMLTTAITNY